MAKSKKVSVDAEESQDRALTEAAVSSSEVDGQDAANDGGQAEEKNDGQVVRIDLNRQAREILEMATAKGVENSFMFVTTFKRYQEQIAHLAKLEESIKESGLMVTKEYVKGRQNLYVNPAVNAYNATCAGADRTAQLLIRYIVQPLKGEDEDGDEFDLF